MVLPPAITVRSRLLALLTRTALAALLAVALAAVLLPHPLGASELTDDEQEGLEAEGGAGVRHERKWTIATGSTNADLRGMALWFWPEGGRIFQLANLSNDTYGELVAYDAESLASVDDTDLDPPAWGAGAVGNNEMITGGGRHHIGAVDRESGRVFVAYNRTIARRTGADGPMEEAQEAAAAGSVCPSDSSDAAGRSYTGGCVGGIHVIDGESLESLGRVRFDPPTAEHLRVWLVPKALEYAPAVPERGWGGRVLMLVEEQTPNAYEGQNVIVTTGGSGALLPRRNNMSVVYAVAFDPDSMRQEWAVRVEGCRSAREERTSSRNYSDHPATVFRAGGADPALYVGCHGTSSQQGVVARIPLDERGIPASLPLRAGDPLSVDPDADDTGPGGLVEPAPRQETYPGPDSVRQILSDPVSQRVLMRVDDSGEVWWVFDGKVNQFIGTIGVGEYTNGDTYAGLDVDTGRLYVLAGPSASGGAPGGLYAADIRRTPLPQALVYRHVTGRSGTSVQEPRFSLSVEPRTDGVTRLFQTVGSTGGQGGGQGRVYDVFTDTSEVSVDPEPDEGGIVRTLDLDEADGVTEATFDGTARGFGFRAIFLGGVEGATRLGPADPVGTVRGLPHMEGGPAFVAQQNVGTEGVAENVRRTAPSPDPCTDAQRELIVAFVGPQGPAVVDASSARGEAQPVLADVRTREDMGEPITRCSPTQWPELWRTAMVSQPPMSEPGVKWPFEDSRSSCTATEDEEDRDSWSDPVAGMFSSRVDCSQEEVGGWGQARGVSLDGVSVANTLSSFRIYRDPERGLVARVESIARGIDLGGVVRIDTIRGFAESWANGRHAGGFHDPALERELGLGGDEDTPGDREADDDATAADDEEFNPWNCDTARPAGTCFERHVFGVTVINPSSGEVAYRCGPCGDEDAMADAMNRAFGANADVRFREPDPELARGSTDGYIAAVTKKDHERFADIVMNADLLETMVPMLEVIRYAPHGRPDNPSYDGGDGTTRSAIYYTFGTPPRGRQVYQFAAVEVSSTYSIQCLLEYDPATNVCAESLPDPASLGVELIDLDGQPLAGGAFELRHDTDGDGVLGLVDALVEGGACATGPDGVCAFDDLEPGSYLVSQTAAPDGYAPVDEPLAVSLFPGDDLTVTFTNVPNVSTIALTVTDLDGQPVEGAVFGVFPDADYVAASATASAGNAEPVATCTTDADGVCSMTVPPGAYVLRQLSAPDGLLPIDDIAFVISQAGQTADVALTLGAAGTDPAPVTEPAAGPVNDFAPPPAPAPLAQPAVSIAPAPARPAPSVTSATPPPPAIAEQVGGTIIRVIRSPASALRLAARSPIEAASLVMVLLLVGLAVMAVIRRQQLATLLAVPPVAGGGHEPGAGPRPPGSPGPGSGGPGGGPSGAPGGGPPGGGRSPSPPDRGPQRPSAAAPTSATGPSVHAATAVLERPVVAGAAPSPAERASASVVIATAHPPLAALVTQRLADAEHCEIFATVDSLDALRVELARTSPDVVVVDLTLPANGETDLCDVLGALHPPERTLALVPPGRSPQALVIRGNMAGIAGLLVADEDIGNGQLWYAVRAVAAGRPFYGPGAQAVLRDHWGGRARGLRPPAGLTPRELEVARLAATGVSRSEIAQQLYLSSGTVKVHLRVARKKLGVTDPHDPEQIRRRLTDVGGLDPHPND